MHAIDFILKRDNNNRRYWQYDKPPIRQLASTKARVIQCGFCIPGMITRAKALLFIGDPVTAVVVTSEREAEETHSKIKVTYGTA